MKIVSVYAHIKLLQKPGWLENFRKKYNNPFDYHVTLKQMFFVNESELADIHHRLRDLFRTRPVPGHSITLTFDTLRADKDDGSILIMAQANDEILRLQKMVISKLSDYTRYYSAELKQYENHFEPHLTIAFDLGDRFDSALSDIHHDIECVGEVKKILLSCVNEISLKETTNPKNLTVFRL